MKKTLFLLLFANTLAAQTPFLEDIQNFKKQDSIQPPPQGEILFIGSSSFTMWTDVQQYFPAVKIINRGFGGSCLSDQIFYQNDVIYPYSPRQIVIYCGENDLALDSTAVGQTVFDRFRTLFFDIRRRLPEVQIGYVSMKPSPSRAHLLPKIREGNRLIRDFLAEQREVFFADVFSEMLLPDGSPNPSIFLEDRLHMNARGYLIWQRVLLPFLKK